jgi:hypothetical protein
MQELHLLLSPLHLIKQRLHQHMQQLQTFMQDLHQCRIRPRLKLFAQYQKLPTHLHQLISQNLEQLIPQLQLLAQLILPMIQHLQLPVPHQRMLIIHILLHIQPIQLLQEQFMQQL